MKRIIAGVLMTSIFLFGCSNESIIHTNYTELLKKDSRIDKDSIYIIGHSMGAMLAPRIDAEGGDYAGLILMAGTPRKIEEVLEEQLEAMSQSAKGLMGWFVKKQMTKYIIA